MFPWSVYISVSYVTIHNVTVHTLYAILYSKVVLYTIYVPTLWHSVCIYLAGVLLFAILFIPSSILSPYCLLQERWCLSLSEHWVESAS